MVSNGGVISAAVTTTQTKLKPMAFLQMALDIVSMAQQTMAPDKAKEASEVTNLKAGNLAHQTLIFTKL